MTSLAMTALAITAPTIEYGVLMPFIVIFAAACLGILVEAAAPRSLRFALQMVLTYGGIAIALVYTALNWAAGVRGVVAVGAVTVDDPTYFFWIILLVFGAVSFLIFADRKLENGALAFTPQGSTVPGTAEEQAAITARVEHTEVFPLAMFALSGMMLFPASNDLLTMFVALEILSLPLYLLCGLARRRRLLSQESSMKYFLLGALSSAFFLYGIALIYGYAGSFQLSDIATALNSSTQRDGLLLAGLGLIGIGLLFKFGAVPFHSWTPDVYAGAPTAVTAFMASCTKIAAVGALLRVFYVAFGGLRWDWQPLLIVVTIATMFVGAVLGITQSDVKRMLAYSSIAHAGFILTAVTAASQSSSGKPSGSLSSISAVGFYLVAYGAATLGAFAIVTMVRDPGGEATLLSSWAGLGRRSPLTAAVFSLFMLSFAGIPLTSGFIGKWSVFAAAWAARDYALVVVAVVLSLVAAFFYLRIIIVMFFADTDTDTDTENDSENDSENEPGRRASPVGRVVRPGWTTLTAIGIGVVATVALGVFPGPVLTLAQRAGEFLR